jgi:hypothetical protein
LQPVAPTRPAAAYIGGKRNLSRRLVALIGSISHSTYAEAFVGMGGVFLRRDSRPAAEVINDWSEDVSTFNSIMADAGTYVEEMTVNFILGRTPLEEFESYQATLQGMGVEEAVAIMQSALDSYNAGE